MATALSHRSIRLTLGHFNAAENTKTPVLLSVWFFKTALFVYKKQRTKIRTRGFTETNGQKRRSFIQRQKIKVAPSEAEKQRRSISSFEDTQRRPAPKAQFEKTCCLKSQNKALPDKPACRREVANFPCFALFLPPKGAFGRLLSGLQFNEAASLASSAAYIQSLPGLHFGKICIYARLRPYRRT